MRGQAARRRVFGLCAVALVIWSLVGCAGGNLFRRATPTPEPVTLKVGSLPYLAASIFQVGIDSGYFAAQGITLELVPFRASAEVMAPLATGEVDAGMITPLAGLFNAVAAGSKMRLVLPAGVHMAGRCAVGGFLVRKEDAESGKYNSPADWKGARLMLSSGVLQGTGGYALAEALRPFGLTAADMETETVDPPVQAEALRAGRGDIVFAAEPWVTQLQSQGDIRLILAAESLIPGIPGTVVVAGERLMGRPAVCERFALAYMQSLRQYSQGATEANVAAAAMTTHLEPELLARLCWSYVPTDGHIDTAALGKFQAWYQSIGLLDRVLDASEYVDSSFVEQAVRALDEQAR